MNVVDVCACAANQQLDRLLFEAILVTVRIVLYIKITFLKIRF